MNKIILFVCRGNIVRSPFAEAVVNKLLFEHCLNKEIVAISRGIQGTKVDPIPVKFSNITFYKSEYHLSKPVLDELGIDITTHISKPIDKTVAREAKIILAIDEKTKWQIIELFPDFKSKVLSLVELTMQNKDFSDPECKGTNTEVLANINDALMKNFDKLLVLVNK